MNKVLQEVIRSIESSNSFIGEGIDNNGNKYTFCNYSIIVNLSPSWVEIIKERFTNFNITHLFLDYYIIGFGKSELT